MQKSHIASVSARMAEQVADVPSGVTTESASHGHVHQGNCMTPGSVSKGLVLGQEEMALKLSSLFKPACGPAQQGKKLSATGLALNMVLSIIGTTVLGISAQMQKGGWILTPILLCIGCAIVSEMTWAVSKVIYRLSEMGVEVRVYQDLAGGVFGFSGRILSSVTSTMALLGMTCNGLVLISKNLDYSLRVCNGRSCGRRWWVLAATPTTLLYSFVDAGDLLKKSAVLGPVVCVGCVVLALIGEGMAAAELPHFPEGCRGSPDLPYWTLIPDLANIDSWMKIADVASYCFYCFAVVVTIPSMQGQMQDPTELVKAASGGYVVCVAAFLAIMLLGYYAFGNLGPDSIIDAMRHNRPAGWWILNRPWETGTGTVVGQVFSWMVTVNLLLTDAIYVPCTVQAVEGWAPCVFRSEQRLTLPKVILRLLYVAFRTLVATMVGKFIELTGLTSSLFCICNNILIPVLAFHRLKAAKVGHVRKALHFVIFLFGVFVIVVGTTSALTSLSMSTATEDTAPGEALRTGTDCQ